MTPQQKTAIEAPCYLAMEAAHPRYKVVDGDFSQIVVVNCGWTQIEQQQGGPIWHASVMAQPGARFDEVVCQERAFDLLHGVGDSMLGLWVIPRRRDRTMHVQRRLSHREAEIVGPCRDIRGTEEYNTRALEVRGWATGSLLRIGRGKVI